MAGQENQQYTVLYGRLSQEDERAGESNSIQHQRTLLEKYAKEKGFENTIFLADEAHKGCGGKRSFSDLLPPRLFVRAAILWKLQGIWTRQS